VSRRITPAVLACGMIGTLAVLLSIQRTGTPSCRSESPCRISDLSALRLSDLHVETLPVYRVVTDGEAVSLGRGGLPTIRVDFDVDGRHVTVWIREP
jgi:hypothetical protein